MSALPPLPVRVVPLPAETVRSFYRRLCEANGLSQRDLWLHIRHLEPNAPLQLNPSTVPHIVSMLGGLPPLYLPDLTSDRECKGHEPDIWSRLCPRCCGSAASASTMCRRCAHGDIASLHLQTGPICVKHRRWHLNGLDLDVSTHRAQLAAQRVLNGSLRMRQIHYRSLEAGAVRELIHGWKPPLARTDHQIALKEELEALPLLVWMLTELSTQFMIEILKDKTGAVPHARNRTARVQNLRAQRCPSKKSSRQSSNGKPLGSKPRIMQSQNCSGTCASLGWGRKQCSCAPECRRCEPTSSIT